MSAVPRVAVGVATYNGATYLPEQLDTIFAQTHPAVEVVAVDDGSADGTWELLQQYARRHPLTALRNERNLGLVGNFERVLRACHATGAEFVALADQDDIWRPHRVAELVTHIGGATLIYSPAEWVLKADGSLTRPDGFAAYSAFCRRRGSGRRVRELIANNFVVSHQVLFRRELVPAAVPFPPGLRFHDHWVALTAARQDGVQYHPADLMVYRQHAASATFHAGASRERSLRDRLGGWLARHGDYLAGVRADIDRLAAWEQLPTFTAAERAFIRRLLRVHRGRLTGGPHPAGLFAAGRVAPYYLTDGRAARVRHLLSAAVGPLTPDPCAPSTR